MNGFGSEIMTNVLKYVDYPLNLALTCRYWLIIFKDPYARTEWLIMRYGKTHALFHAVRLGPSFIDIPVCQSLIAKRVILSRYFVQKLLMHFGKYDEKLIEFKIDHNTSQIDADRIRAKTRSSWASNLRIEVFNFLLVEGYNQLSDANEKLASKGNDMELFDLLSTGPGENLELIEDLILNKRFIPFPPRPKAPQLDLNSDPHIYQQPIPEEYPSKDGHENDRQLNVIARRILIHPNLVNLWRQIGYFEICDDVNDLVMQGALLILFPPTPASDWSCPTRDKVISRLVELTDLGFKLHDSIIIDVLHMFEHRLDEIGNILWDSFVRIRNSEQLNSLALRFFREAFKPERNLKKDDLLNFLKSKFDFHEQVVKQVIKQYFTEEEMSNIVLRRKSLILSPKIYQYILNTYGNESGLASMCLEDILILRVYVDMPNLEAPELSPCTLESIGSTFDLYIKAKVPFKPKCMNSLLKATSVEIIKPFFDFLSSFFGMKPTSEASESGEFNNLKRRKNRSPDGLILRWMKKLGKIDSLNESNNEELSINFRENFMNFLKRLDKETLCRIREDNKSVMMNNCLSDYQDSE